MNNGTENARNPLAPTKPFNPGAGSTRHQPTGDAAREAYEQAARLVKEGRFDEARAVQMRSSDRIVIEKAIAQVVNRDAKSMQNKFSQEEK